MRQVCTDSRSWQRATWDHARKTRSGLQADALVRRHLLPRWGSLPAPSSPRAIESDDGPHQGAGRCQPDAGGRFGDLLLGRLGKVEGSR